MTDYTEAAQGESIVRCSDNSIWFATFVPAGTDGWIEPVICGHDYIDTCVYWSVNGRALCAGDPDIVEVVEND